MIETLPKPGAWRTQFPWPETQGHKYSRGHVAVIGGEIGMSGASCLAVMAALRTIAGLVTIAVPEDQSQFYAQRSGLSVMVKGYEDLEALKAWVMERHVTALVYGPGAGRDPENHSIINALLQCELPLVLDADVLHLLKKKKTDYFDVITARQDPVILTPHEGEFARLFGQFDDDMKLEVTLAASQLSGAYIMHKGQSTVIATPEGKVSEHKGAPPTLATAGSGDVLAGMVASLLGARMPLPEALYAAYWLHAKAAEIHGPGLIADDIIMNVPVALKELQGA